MRNLNKEYDHVYVDIDDTLIYGFWTDLMRHTWNFFRDNTLSQFLMYLQAKFKFYKVNHKLVRMLGNCTNVTFLTVRAPSFYTRLMLCQILQTAGFIAELVELGTDNGAFDKAEFIAKDAYENNYERVCLVDDSQANRDMAIMYGFDIYNPTGMYERLIP
ncbi:MAG: hypothetical protein NC218_08405 [Acetobacter sp.]|nr:hypothetical protein [Acetobacter sp.]